MIPILSDFGNQEPQGLVEIIEFNIYFILVLEFDFHTIHSRLWI